MYGLNFEVGLSSMQKMVNYSEDRVQQKVASGERQQTVLNCIEKRPKIPKTKKGVEQAWDELCQAWPKLVIEQGI